MPPAKKWCHRAFRHRQDLAAETSLETPRSWIPTRPVWRFRVPSLYTTRPAYIRTGNSSVPRPGKVNLAMRCAVAAGGYLLPCPGPCRVIRPVSPSVLIDRCRNRGLASRGRGGPDCWVGAGFHRVQVASGVAGSRWRGGESRAGWGGWGRFGLVRSGVSECFPRMEPGLGVKAELPLSARCNNKVESGLFPQLALVKQHVSDVLVSTLPSGESVSISAQSRPFFSEWVRYQEWR